MTNTVTLTHRNVCKEGFTVENTVDSVFLDLPAPWDAVEHAKKALRKDRITRICCFSPCMEQVLRTVAALNDAGFTEISMYETLLRPHEVAQVPQLQSISEVSERLKDAEKKREEKRLRQIANNKARLAATEPTKRKRGYEDDDPGRPVETPVQDLSSSDESPETKRVRTQEGKDAGVEEAEADVTTVSVQVDMIKADENEVDKLMVDDESRMEITGTTSPSSPIPDSRISVSNALPEVRGHTSYLTFAVLVPFTAPLDSSSGTGGEAVSTTPSEPAPAPSEAPDKSSIVAS
ncbi:hypothetical protein NP233_g10247 [Leucocoprinus birnbaumii]|uniref:tRNA (adenine(58)-N(1))-methyltransferase catalytic subunit TRM61 n=1 Tax=Leucocoprinus birnbaumii TaxID=56174 RepID=A0AAD5VJ12_9AGAR|nr:hypothetical protein NP233_g10247 [Leucocoprinus birnbaumii]